MRLKNGSRKGAETSGRRKVQIRHYLDNYGKLSPATLDHSGQIRRRGEKEIEMRTECGAVELSGGTKFSACICTRTSGAGSSRIPPAIRAKLIGPIETGTAYWEDKTKLLSVCWKIGTKPPAATQTKEHILLAKQVGVPSL